MNGFQVELEFVWKPLKIPFICLHVFVYFNGYFCCSDVSFFSESLEKYNSEHEQAVSILEHRPIGMILVDCKKLKEVLIPSPLKCLAVSNTL